jgi:Beta-propeller repeat
MKFRAKFKGYACLFPCLVAAAMVLFASALSRTAEAQAKERPADTKVRAADSFARLPLSFEANQGQADPEVKFLARGQGYTLFLTRGGGAVLTLHKPARKPKSLRRAANRPVAEPEPETVSPSAVLRMSLTGATGTPQLEGVDELSGKANYFIGNDPKKWRTNVPLFTKVKYRDVYPGVDVVYYGNQKQLEHDFVVAPGADPHAITLNFAGAKKLSLDAQGSLALPVREGQVRLDKPRIYQEVDGARIEISGNYVLKNAHEAGFQIAAYDRSRPLIIDPVLAYSTYLGGSLSDISYAIAVDSGGNAYVTGLAASANFPTTPGAFQTTAHAKTGAGTFAGNAFVAKLNPAGSALVYSTYLGGSANHNCTQISPCSNNGDQGAGIAVDTAGNAYVTGSTTSSDFPTTLGAFQPGLRGLQNAFATKLNSDGTALLYSTYLGGSNADWGFGVAIDSQDNAYLTGATCSNDFPVTSSAFQSSLQASSNGVIGSQIRCVSNAFVSKLNSNTVLSKLNPALPELVSLVYSTYLGGASGDAAYGVAVDSQDNAYVTGTTYSFNFPVTALAFQMSHQAPTGAPNAFVSKLNPAEPGAQSLVYSTYFGGSAGELAYGIAVDSQDNAYVTGVTCSANFPVTPLAFQTTLHQYSCNAFATKFNPTGSGLVYSTYLGGSGSPQGYSSDYGFGIALDAAGNAYVTGYTDSTSFPTTPDAFQPQLAKSPSWAPFVTVLNSAGSALVYSTYLGDGWGYGIAVDKVGNAYVTGGTASTSFPTTPGAFQTAQGSTVSGFNTFVTKFSGFPTQ